MTRGRTGGRAGGGTAVAATVQRLLPLHTSVWLLGLLALLGVAWLVVHTAGGTHTAWPHLFYLPIVLAAVPFGLPGALAAAVAAMVLCGPLMPLDVAAGTAQATVNWATRGAFFLAVGAVAGSTGSFIRHSVEQDLRQHLHRELQASFAGSSFADSSPQPDPEASPRIREIRDQRRLHTVFQPIYSLSDGSLQAVEALTRFDVDPYEPPNVWFDRASRAGMTAELELVAIETALETAAGLDRSVRLQLNVTPETLDHPWLLPLLASADHPIVVEVTEHAVIEDYNRLRPVRDQLRDAGVLLAVDDAGAGFASLRHIVWLAPEIIKLDLSLTRNVRADPVRHALAEAIIQFATRTDSLLVVEGIEEVVDLLTWQRLGAGAAQGYLLARPGPLPFLPISPVIPTRRRDRALALVRTGTD